MLERKGTKPYENEANSEEFELGYQKQYLFEIDRMFLLGINPFHATCLFLYLLKNLWFSDVSMGYRKRPLA